MHTTIPILICGFLLYTKQFLTPAGSPTGQLNSKITQFWHYLPNNINSIRFHKLRAQFHKTAPISDDNSKSRLLPGLSRWLSGRIHLQCRRHRFDPSVRNIPWKRKWQPTLVFLPGKSHRQRSLAGYSPQGRTWLNDQTALLPVLLTDSL